MESEAHKGPESELAKAADSSNGATLPDRTKQPKPKKEKAPKPKKAPSAPRQPTKPKQKPHATPKPSPAAPDAIFKAGFLADVYNERPVEKVVTRCMCEPGQCVA